MPKSIQNEEHLETMLSEPSEAAIRAVRQLQGDIVLLGVGGKMGPSLARMARRASDAVDASRRIIGVSRFSDTNAHRALQAHGVETIQGDSLEEGFIDSLPEVPNVIYMTGLKFGTSDDPSVTWATNVLLPSVVCRKFRHSRIVAFSSGNIYPMVSIDGGGSVETDPPKPWGEYPITVLGRERVFEYYSSTLSIPVSIVRLNYAVELRYGVLLDLAQQVFNNETIDLSMGYVNVIWQADANAMALAALGDTSTPPHVVNVAGPETLRVSEICERLGAALGKPARVQGSESDTAYLSNASKGYATYGRPRVPAAQLIQWVADWVKRGGRTWDKPTHFGIRDGKF